MFESELDLSKIGWFCKSENDFIINGYILDSSKSEGNIVLKIKKINCDLIQNNSLTFSIKGLSREYKYDIPQYIYIYMK